MPVFVKAATELCRQVEGGVSFNAIDLVARVGPLDSRTDVDLFEWQDKWYGILRRVIESVDWNRVLLEATATHLRRQRDDPDHTGHDLGDETCASCLEAALLEIERTF